MSYTAEAADIPPPQPSFEMESLVSVADDSVEPSADVRRRLLEGNLQDSLPTLHSRVVRIFVSSSFPGNLSRGRVTRLARPSVVRRSRTIN